MVMTDASDEGLAELIVREQRGFRRILFAGVVTLIVMALTSAALGVYLYVASASLADTTRALQRHAFDVRRSVDAQNNRIAAQEIAIRRAYDEIRLAAGDYDIEVTPQAVAGARQAAENFLLSGRVPTLDEQRALEQLGAGDAPGVSAATAALLRGVDALVGYDRRGEEIPADAATLPPALNEARAAFEAARGDPALGALANTGLAWIMFEDASSTRRNYSVQSCSQVFTAVEASAANEEALGPQPLYWRAQCERKLGMTSSALADYARALRANPAAATARRTTSDAAELTLAMNAYHGVGTTLIASAGIPDDAPGMGEALGIAEGSCALRPIHERRSPRMALALSCLDEAIGLRRALGQTPNQQSGSGENISFAHLRDGDFGAAYDNTVAIERTGLFPWNEVVRALAADEVSRTDADRRRAAEAAVAAAEAQGNVAMFTVGQFNICELQALFDPPLFERVQAIIAEAHPGEEVGCVGAG